jgi:hypothetical protein
MPMKLPGIINADFDVTGQILTSYFQSVKYFRKNGNKIGHWISKTPIIQLGGRFI